jgi:hypothetical protein
MGVVVGPILERPGGYAFDTWTALDGVRRGYVYRRFEDARYACKAEINRATVDIDSASLDGSVPPDDVCICGTVEQFLSALVDRGLRVMGAVLPAGRPEICGRG